MILNLPYELNRQPGIRVGVISISHQVVLVILITKWVHGIPMSIILISLMPLV